MSYFIEANFPIILKNHLKSALDEYSKFESKSSSSPVNQGLARKYSQLQIIDEANIEELEFESD